MIGQMPACIIYTTSAKCNMLQPKLFIRFAFSEYKTGKRVFVLADDVIALLERAALEPLPCQPVAPKDDKTSQSRMKVGIIQFDMLYLGFISKFCVS